jgi:hypothetical protein
MGQEYLKPAAPKTRRSERTQACAQISNHPCDTAYSMLKRLILTLSLLLITSPVWAAEADYLSSFRWMSEDPLHGGFSGLHMNEDGTEFTTISDRASISTGSLERDVQGRVSSVVDTKISPIKGRDRDTLRNYQDDSEGLAVGNDGTIYISFEGDHRVWSYASATSRAHNIPRTQAFKDFQRNSSLEALAIDAAGSLYTLPERSGSETLDFPVYRLSNGVWEKPFTLPRRDKFLPVGMDIGPDGKLYLLERWFRGIGFSSRVRRFDLSDTSLTNEVTLLTSHLGSHDNLEGLSVWHDGENIRLTMISDDNFKPFQITEFVEYTVIE